jgi:hypothetical protein
MKTHLLVANMVLIRDLYLIADHVPLEMYTWKRI